MNASTDPEAAQRDALARQITELNGEVEAAWTVYQTILARRGATIERYNELVARARARATAPPPVPAPALPAPDDAVPARPESSPRTVQNVLFVLGGLLLGSAAIVFTAVAWANVGTWGRAAILAGVTVLVLAVPPVARVRRLTGTAETFAALGLLLVLLDGYAAWAVDLVGVTDRFTPARYASIVFGVTVAVALGYRRMTRLAGPGYAALVVAQPVPVLALAGTGLGPAGWSATLSCLALADLAVLRWTRPAGLRATAWVVGGLALASALGYAALAGFDRTWVPGAARAGGALVLAALVVVAASSVWRPLRHPAGAVLVGALALAGVEIFSLAYPHTWLAYEATGLAVLAVGVRLLPAAGRRGPWLGVLVTAGLAAYVPVAVAFLAGARTAGVAWVPDRPPTATQLDVWPVVALALLAAAFAVALAEPVLAGAAGLVLVALALPATVPFAWWAPSIVDGVAAVPLALLATRSRRWSAVAGPGALLLTAHAGVVGLGAPGVSAAVLAGVLALATGTALLSRDNGPVRTVATAVAAAVPAGLGGALGAWAGVDVVPYAVAGLVATAGVTLLVRRAPGAAVGVVLGGLYVLAVAAGSGWYLGVPVACAALVLRGRLRWLGVPAALIPVLAAGPALGTLLAYPYRWLGAIWTGAPVGTGVPGHRYGPDAVSLALLALALAVGLRRHAAIWATVTGGLALACGTAAIGAPWPWVPAVTLTVGLGTALVAAVTPRPRLAVLAVFAVLVGLAGLAGLLPEKATTLAGLGAVLVTSLVCGAAGRGLVTRTAGWVSAVGAGTVLGFASARAADLPLRDSAFWVLGVAALALAGSVRLGRGTGPAVEAAAHASALAALLLTTGAGRYPAVVLALWGVALGLRALHPGGHRARAVAGVACELVAYWLLLWTGGVRLTEAYTVPAAAVGVLAGALAQRARPALHSWSAYGPALLAGFGPSLALVLTVPGEPLRRLALGGAGVLVVVLGSAYRRQAPVVVGGAALGVLALHEAVLLWDLLPRWIPLALAGLVLVGLAITYERRLRDLGRLRTAVGRMH